ncbi:PAS domain S-box-containing protein [Methanofollis sp. W23]|uniref:PAS domain S-box protein n=1 Tax=Methanofollis sp. W23 TaxID=2817849 RepID=UPI001AE7643B|nr:PAS domain S-box protein [Methanofollis sp. W23]MBP2146910.1 PAS domain S-box-containing protein [Methanofollis sp. W23]
MPPGEEERGPEEDGPPWEIVLGVLPFGSLVTRPDDPEIVYLSPSMAGILGTHYHTLAGSDASQFFQYLVLPGGGVGMPGGAPDGTLCRFLSGKEKFFSWKSHRIVSHGTKYILDTFEEEGLLGWEGSFDPSIQARHAGNIILKWTPDLRITYIERSSADYLGYIPEELLGKPLLKTFLPEYESDGRSLLPIVETIIRDPEENSPYEAEVIKKDGTRARIIWFSRNLRGSDGEVVEYLSVGSEIREQGGAPPHPDSRHAVISVSREGKVTAWDGVATEIFGYSESEVLGSDFIDLIVPESRRELHRKIVTAVQDAQSWIRGFIRGHGYRQGICLKKDGTRFPVELSVIPGPGVPTSPFSEGVVIAIRALTLDREAECQQIRYARNIALLSGTAMAFVEMDDGSDIYGFVGKQIQSLAGRSIVVVSAYSSQDRSFSPQVVLAEDTERAAYMNALGSDVVGSSFLIPDEVETLITTERGIIRAPGLHEAMLMTCPPDVCTVLEEKLGILGTYVIPFVRRDQVFGVAIVLTKESPRLRNPDIIEAFMNQTAVALQRHHVGEALKESEKTARALLDATPDLAFLTDRKGRVISYNEAARLAFRRKNTFIRQKIGDIAGPGCVPGLHEAFDTVAGSGKSTQLEMTWKEQVCLVRVSPVSGPDREVTGFAVFIRDITDSRRAEEALMVANRYLNNTIEHLPDAILVTDTDGRVVSWNCAMEELSGIRKDEILGEGDYAYAVPFYGIRRPILIDMAEAGEEEVREMYPMARRMDGLIHSYVTADLHAGDGRALHLSATASPIVDHDGRVVGRIESIRDVTMEKAMEEEYLRNEKLESIGLLAGGIAHDFNNILTSVLGNITLSRMKIREGSSPDTNLEEAENTVKKARAITQQLLTFSQGGAPILETVEPLDFSSLVLETAEFVLRGTRSSFEAAFDPGLWQVSIDQAQFSQVIQHLAVNADQAMPDGGKIQINVHNRVVEEDGPVPPGRYVVLSVADTGTGIPTEHLPRIFDPYFTTRGDGYGLGLATVRSIVRNHGGYITAASGLQGSVFTVYLPATSTQGQREFAGDREKGERPHKREARILFMDDDRGVLSSIVPLLESEGYCVTAASEGSEAVREYITASESGRPYDLVIMDLTVPGGMGGVEAIAELRKIDPSVRAIVSSGYSTDPVMSAYQEYGFAGVVRKPYPIDELFAEVRRVLSL